jgi:outer membrane lipoprotein-sorting protein
VVDMAKIMLILIILICGGLSFSQDAKEIVEKADKQLRGESSKSTVTMNIIRPQWSRSLSMKSWSKGDRYSLILITAPARDNGTAFLKRGTEMWQWLPTVERVIKIPPSMMNQSWMGSDFTNDDLVREASVVHDYNHTLLSDTTIDGIAAFRVELIPKPDAPVVWGKVILWITKDEYIQRKGFFYDERGKLINELSMYNVKEMDGRKIPFIWEMIPVDKQGYKTALEYQSIDFNTPINESFFSLQNLRSVR